MIWKNWSNFFKICNPSRQFIYDQFLRVFVKVVEKLMPGQEQGKGPMDLSKFFPDFLWVLRDQYLDFTNETGRLITPREYFHNLLTDKGADPRAKIKLVLATSFKSTDMDCIPSPHCDANVVKYMDRQSDENLQGDFVVSLRRVIENAVKNTKFLKSIGTNAAIDGVGFAALTEKLVDVINSPGAIPTIHS